VDPLFDDRAHAGRELAGQLADLIGEDIVVLALPRGGVAVGLEVARRIDADLDVLVVQRLGVPGQEERALAAVGAGGTVVVDHRVAAEVGVNRETLRAAAESWAEPLGRRAAELRHGRPQQPVRDRVAVVVDDGLATGATMRAGLEIVRSADPAQLIAAAPIAAPDVHAGMAALADRVECLHRPAALVAVGHCYRHFAHVTDDDVRWMLGAAPSRN
jgi:putative phosphoribosyl transferase